MAYEGEDAHEENGHDLGFEANVMSPAEEFAFRTKRVASSDSFEIEAKEVFINQEERDADVIESGRISDPGWGVLSSWLCQTLSALALIWR